MKELIKTQALTVSIDDDEKSLSDYKSLLAHIYVNNVRIQDHIDKFGKKSTDDYMMAILGQIVPKNGDTGDHIINSIHLAKATYLDKVILATYCGRAVAYGVAEIDPQTFIRSAKTFLNSTESLKTPLQLFLSILEYYQANEEVSEEERVLKALSHTTTLQCYPKIKIANDEQEI